MKEIENILNETLTQVIEFRQDYVSNEQAVRTQLIEPVLNVLGWKTYNPKFVRPNATDEDGKIPDYTLIKNGKTSLIVEAKNLSVDLQNKKIIDQLANYCFKSGIDFGILTNGVKWLLFKTFEKNPKDRIVWQVDIENDKIEHVARNLSSFSFSNIDTLDALLKKSKILEDNWKELVCSQKAIVSIISQKLIEKIKSNEPGFKIDQADLQTFVDGKIFELFELTDSEMNDISEKDFSIKNETEFDEVENKIFKRRNNQKSREKIFVKFPDGLTIKHRKVVDVFIDTIKRIGPEKIIPLNIIRSGVPLVSTTKDEFYNQHKVDNFWVMVHSSTRSKIRTLHEISEKMNLNLMIDTFTIE